MRMEDEREAVPGEAAAGGGERAIGGSGGLSFEEMMERELAKEAAAADEARTARLARLE